jgi:asparagine synthase (glutamine-hydrolysing)
MLADLRGMYAFAILDRRDGTLFLARDPYGIKPLYYAADGGTFRFASQVKALLAGGAVSREPDPAGQVGFFLWGSVPEPFTGHLAIKALPAGCHMTVTREGVGDPVRHHSLAGVYADAERRAPARLDPVEWREAARAALLDSVRHHLVADVPVGAFLSAGIDSGALVGLMRDAGQSDIQTVTLSFEEFRGRADDEGPLAAEVAARYGTRHVNRIVTEAEFQADLPLIQAAMDQPSVDGINTWFVSKAAAELGLKVVLSGLGGDELLGGYPSFRDIPQWVARMAPLARIPFAGSLSRRAASLIRPERFGLNPKLAGMLEHGGSYAGAYLLRRGLFMPHELGEVLDPDTIRAGLARLAPLAPAEAALDPTPSSPFARVAVLESALYMRNQLLRDTDWASMAHSLEARVPLVDSVLLETLAPFLAHPDYRPGKRVLAEAPSVPLPESLIGRPKTGFSTPIARWLQNGPAAAARARVPSLAHARTPWARRWAYDVAATAAAA